MIARYHPRIATVGVNQQTVRLQALQRGGRFAHSLPDALLALLFLGAALLPFALETLDELVFVLIAEGGFLLAQGTLVDIATRLKKRPPIWAAALILIAVVLFSNYTLDVLRMAWQRGSLVFVPLLISVAERGTILWRMPGRTAVEKMAARALISNRIVTGLGLFGLVTLAMVAGVVFPSLYDFSTAGSTITLLAGAAYFAIATYDDWRVRGRKFAEQPRVLFRWDVIGIKYLEPV